MSFRFRCYRGRRNEFFFGELKEAENATSAITTGAVAAAAAAAATNQLRNNNRSDDCYSNDNRQKTLKITRKRRIYQTYRGEEWQKS